VMKKHYKAYVNGFDGAKELRVRLMETNSFREVEDIVENWLSQKNGAKAIPYYCMSVVAQ